MDKYEDFYQEELRLQKLAEEEAEAKARDDNFYGRTFDLADEAEALWDAGEEVDIDAMVDRVVDPDGHIKERFRLELEHGKCCRDMPEIPDLPRFIDDAIVAGVLRATEDFLVYKAFQFVEKRFVAIKRPTIPPAHCNVRLPRFRKEIEAVSAMDHWNIEVLLCSFIEDENSDKAYIMTRLVDGSTFDKSKVTDRTCLEIARGLQHIHSRGYLHCNMKAETILVRQCGSPVIIDFEHAEKIGDSTRGPRSDIYAFGELLSEKLGENTKWSPIIEKCLVGSFESADALINEIETLIENK